MCIHDEEEGNGTYTDLIVEELYVLNSFVENGCCISLRQEYVQTGEGSIISQEQRYLRHCTL